MGSRFEDEPRSLKREEVRKEREELLRTEPRIQRLRGFVEDMRVEKRGLDVPDFDPLDGGVEARCLFLFEAAGGKTIPGGKTKGSGFASRNNNDESAEKFFRLNGEVGLDRELTASWNIVPWALREKNRNRKPTPEELDEGLRLLGRLLERLPEVEVAVLCGEYARRATGFLYTEHSALHVLHAPHPGPQSMLQPGKEEHLWAAIEKASRIIEGAAGGHDVAEK